MSWRERVTAEKAELDTRLAALTKFIRSDDFYALPSVQQYLLHRQESAMGVYSDILGQRIAQSTSEG